MARGRKTILTPDLQEQICILVRLGNTIPDAMLARGIVWDTGKFWISKGKQGRQPYADFVRALEQAKAQWKCGSVARISKSPDWKAHAWMLERREPEYRAPRFQSLPEEERQAEREVPRFERELGERSAEDLDYYAIHGRWPDEEPMGIVIETDGESVDELPNLAAELGNPGAAEAATGDSAQPLDLDPVTGAVVLPRGRELVQSAPSEPRVIEVSTSAAFAQLRRIRGDR